MKILSNDLVKKLNFLINFLIKNYNTMSSDLNIFIYDFIERKRPEYFDAIHALNDNARLSNNIYGDRFHVNKDCIKYNKQKRN